MIRKTIYEGVQVVQRAKFPKPKPLNKSLIAVDLLMQSGSKKFKESPRSKKKVEYEQIEEVKSPKVQANIKGQAEHKRFRDFLGL